ncbi:MAG: hypothetical protein ABSG41_14685 [Bryobacteraceae bacterium]
MTRCSSAPGGIEDLVASSTAKMVVIRRFDRENLTGFVNPLSYLQPHSVELLKPDGALVLLPYEEVKSVCFVKDFEAEAESRRIFLTRPKLEGLWVRMRFRDGEIMDGILPNNLLAWEIAGYTVTPPEPDANNQRVFVPRSALSSIQVLGVVGSPLRPKRKKAPAATDQPTLF